MALAVKYLTVDGEVLSETRGGTRRDYVPNPLGSTIALLNSSQTKTDTMSYWPYGEEIKGTSTATPLRHVGVLGYYTDSSSRVYVRARTLEPQYGKWMTVDRNWPSQLPYQYAFGSPTYHTDCLGLAPSGASPASCEYTDPRDPKCNCLNWLNPGDKPNKDLIDCLLAAGQNSSKIQQCFSKYGSNLKPRICNYIGCLAGSNIPGGTPGFDPICGNDDYPTCYARYIYDLCRCAEDYHWWAPIAAIKCTTQAYADFNSCILKADPYDEHGRSSS